MAAGFVSPCVVFQLLAELLRSKNPEDLQEANRLIKNMVKEVRTNYREKKLSSILLKCTL